jgi:hypothetical protein
MSKHHRAADGKLNQKGQRSVRPVAAELAGDRTGLPWLTEMPGGPLAAAGATMQAHAAQLGGERLHTAQRQALATQIGQIQGNDHLQRVIASQEWVGPSKRELSSIDASTLQRAMPNIQEPTLGLVQQTTPDPLTAVETYLNTPTTDPRDSRPYEERRLENGQAAVNAAVRHLGGTVQYSQGDIVQGSESNPSAGTPEFRLSPSGSAINAFRAGQLTGVSGCQYATNETPPRFKVEIYPRAFIGSSPAESLAYLLGTLVHEYIHIQQSRPGAGGQATTEAEREFQAWLWQVEHASELGIAGGTGGYSQIIRQLQTYYGQITSPDAETTRRYRRAMFASSLEQCERYIAQNYPAEILAGAVQRLTQRWNDLQGYSALRSPFTQRYQSVLNHPSLQQGP